LESQNRPSRHSGTGEAKVDFQDLDVANKKQPKNDFSKRQPLRFERVNEVTWKLTDGEGSNVPARLGFWGGYRTSRAVAWVMNVAPGEWLARHRDQCCGPSSIAQAKANALRMARGRAGDWVVRNPIAELNELQAILVDRHP
jgi:hypothetical protein